MPYPPDDALDREDRSGAGPRPRARWVGQSGVTGRLLVAVLLPVTVLAIAAGLLLSERYDTAQEASSIAGDVPALTGLVKLRTLLDQERIPAEAVLRERELDINVPDPASAFGFTHEPEATARNAVDAQLRLSEHHLPRDFASELNALRREIDGGRIGARAVDRAFAALSDQLASAFSTELSLLEGHTANTSQAAALNLSLRTLGQANDALGAGATETGDVSDLYLDPAAQRPSDLSALGAQIALLGSADAHLRTESVGTVRVAFLRLQNSPPWQQYEAAAGAAASGAAPLPGLTAARSSGGHGALVGRSELLPLVGLFASGLSGVEQLYRLVATAELDTHQIAAKLQASSTADFRTLAIEMIIAVGLTIAVALLLARSISRPLHRLENHARAVSNGDLELPALQARGPKETVITSKAFNDLVLNLRLLEAKTRTLAECSFDDPILAEPLPGRLGQALQDSVAVLSGSIIERDGLQQRLVHQATHDSLTGLHNRAAAVEFLDQAIARASRASKALAVLFIDLDDFKRANDTHGHAVGDVILKEIACRMDEAARREDFIARLGGDEFVVIAEGLNDGSEATAIAARLINAAGEPVRANKAHISVTAHVGIAFALDGAADHSSQLLARADLALDRAKHTANSRVEIYDECLQHELIARAQIEDDLRAALDNSGAGLFLQYQPVIDAPSGKLVCVEALVRWERPGHGACQPNDFIPAAEASDLIIRLDRWVLASALGQLREWDRCGLGKIGLAVNISGRHLLSGTLIEHVTEALSASGIEPRRLSLELTETVLLTDLPAIGVELERLRSLGVRVSIDDFGTGYTSLAHLQHLTVDEIKIDRSFVQQLPGGRDSSLVRMVTDLGHHLGVSIVAEGVESDDQLAALRDVGCDSVQGFLIARPLAVAHLTAWHLEHTQGQSNLKLGAEI